MKKSQKEYIKKWEGNIQSRAGLFTKRELYALIAALSNLRDLVNDCGFYEFEESTPEVLSDCINLVKELKDK